MKPTKEIQIITKEEIDRALAREDSNLRQWAIKRKYPVQTVYTAVRRHCGSAKRPHGGISREIMKNFAQYVAEQSTVTTNEDNQPCTT